jgi:hypothetical protein
MSTSYRYAILDHLADLMLYLSTAPSFWFSLNLAYDGLDVSLSDRLGRLRWSAGAGINGGGCHKSSADTPEKGRGEDAVE